MTNEPKDRVGTVVGNYRLLRVLGEGGVGTVYEAEHVQLGRKVAIKLLHPDVATKETVTRFFNEARAVNEIRHPNIIDVEDFVTTPEGEHYMLMELLHGEDLRSVIARDRVLDPDRVSAIGEQVASALAAVHRVGIIHRDLKPDNVWLIADARGGFTVRVLDFGIARLSGETRIVPVPIVVDSDAPTLGAGTDTPIATPPLTPANPIDPDATMARTDDRSASETTDRLTMAGSTLGTPHYMSPEQCDGRDAGERSDLYSLGVMTYEMLTGQRPFGGGLLQLIEQHLRVAPPPLVGIPEGIAAVVLRAMSKDPGDRHSSARALAGSLRVAAEGPGTILRRSIALYAERFHEFFRVSVSVSRPPIILAATLILAAILTAILAGPRYGAIVMVLAAMTGTLLWTPVSVMTNATFAAVIERLRLRPLETLDPLELAMDLRRRLGLPATAGYVTTLRSLFRYYLRCELTSAAGTGDLAFLIGFLESVPLAEIGPRCKLLAVSSRRAYTIVRAAILLALFLFPIVEASLVFLVLDPFTKFSTVLAFALAFALVPINAVFINPIFSSALTLVYFRARQANGEDVPLAAVLPGRV